jgi:ergothioneine biosynthesis protein EgtC
MCRLVGYLGAKAIALEDLVSKPSHSLTVQSYQPQQMTAGLLNADGFGIGWYGSAQNPQLPFKYKNLLPIWSDINLEHLGRYIHSHCILGNVRSATIGQSVDLVNCQPFGYGQVLGIHNGYIENFRRSLYRPLKDLLKDKYYEHISGNTDSEHILALLWQNLEFTDLTTAMRLTLIQIGNLCKKQQVNAALNLVISDGLQLVACRCATRSPAPSLYYLQSSDPSSIIVASEPLFEHSDWQCVAENSILAIAPDFTISSLELGSMLI